jgi:GTP cyclohydrolase I
MQQTDRLEKATKCYEKFMRILGIPEDANSKDTARRVSKMMLEERCKSLYEEPPKLTFFPRDGYDEYVVVKDIPYYSTCSHHHVTFYGKAHIAYHPKDKVLGISKFARVVSFYAGKPQIQETMTNEIIDYLWKELAPNGIIVRIDGEHLCMCSRGARAIGSSTITQAIRGQMDKTEVDNLFK